MMLVAEVGQYLAAQGLGVFGDDSPTIFVEELPESPDAVIAVRSTGGYSSDVKLRPDEPTFQVLTRNPESQDAWAAAQQVYDLLHGLRARRLVDGGAWIILCQGIQSGPTCLGRDANGRMEYSINFRALINNESRRQS